MYFSSNSSIHSEERKSNDNYNNNFSNNRTLSTQIAKLREIRSQKQTKNNTFISKKYHSPRNILSPHRNSPIKVQSQENTNNYSKETINNATNTLITPNKKEDNNEINLLRRQLQTTLELLLESTQETSKLRLLLEYTSDNSNGTFQQDVLNYIDELQQNYSHKIDSSKIINDLSYKTELINNLRILISVKSDYEIEKKKSLENEYAMKILHQQYIVSLHVLKYFLF